MLFFSRLLGGGQHLMVTRGCFRHNVKIMQLSGPVSCHSCVCRLPTWRWLVEQKKKKTHTQRGMNEVMPTWPPTEPSTVHANSAWTLPPRSPTAGVVQLTVAVVEVHLLLFGVLLCFAVSAAPEREETRQRYHGDAMRLLLTITYIVTRKVSSLFMSL